jgi:hypothetical protein
MPAAESLGWGWIASVCGVAVWIVAISVWILGSAAGAQGTESGLLSVPPRAWAEDAAQNELKTIRVDGVYLRYRSQVTNAKGTQVRDVIQSRDGTVARMIAKDGRLLTAEEDSGERERLEAMLDSPAAFARHVRGDVSGKKMAADLVTMMPDAMQFSYVPGQPQIGGLEAHPPEVVLDFRPNPKWSPPTMTAECLTGFQGRLWIDSASHRLVRIEGTVFHPINFGMGVLAHIYAGGTLVLEQTDAAKGHWIFSHFSEHVTARALMLKTVRENLEVTSGDFRVVPAMSYQAAIHLLLDTPLPQTPSASLTRK